MAEHPMGQPWLDWSTDLSAAPRDGTTILIEEGGGALRLTRWSDDVHGEGGGSGGGSGWFSGRYEDQFCDRPLLDRPTRWALVPR